MRLDQELMRLISCLFALAFSPELPYNESTNPISVIGGQYAAA
jgi:hypothetical protein